MNTEDPEPITPELRAKLLEELLNSDDDEIVDFNSKLKGDDDE